MFDAMEAINDIIDDINDDYYESCYDAIYEELCERVDNEEISLDEAKMINEAAAEKYLYEKSKNVDEALETEDDDKKKKESNKNIKKKINKKKLAAGVGLGAAAAGAATIGAIRRKNAKDVDQYLNYLGDIGDVMMDEPLNFKKQDQIAKNHYKGATKAVKRAILDNEKENRERTKCLRRLQRKYK